ncbi:putative mucin/carbohydrate-binding domain-containing protein [Enterococcus hirae]|uniref:putative mucin/carbohydrate-binding domain-containing protein n=1 Tax=Enterococcus hirae TaxID=1354 RepID=UPI001378D02C|nr:putative mucin/carbohydrate-binding domain-containing protein [Enterococcus hirae]MCK6145236.1 M60 family metallopeptidase [Enterococcus hirae]MCK6172955.1 M60 family metallopeptidase [Enterococcus hirae]NBA17254.1 enhancin [Enterococcus hirae]
MKKYAVSLLLFVFGIFVLSANVGAQEVTSKEIFSIPEPTWIFNSGMSKGKNHDRQDLGFILSENTELRMRQTNAHFKNKLKLRLLGNDKKNEKSIEVGSNWVSIRADEPLVPFIDTPYGEGSAQIEYEVVTSKEMKALPVYEYHGNETMFFSMWDTEDAEYALIQGVDFQLLVPKLDKELVRNLKDFPSIDALIEYHHGIFALFNGIAGFDGSAPENQNGANRYFLKADDSGAGAAYYGGDWTANSEPTTDMWLKELSWATLHEIAHGYQAGFDGQDMYTGEVSNNLFGVQYQYEKYGKKADDIGWLFNLGKKEEVENKLYDKLIRDGDTYHDVDVREQLILLTMFKQKAGNDSFTKIYQEYRKMANQSDFKDWEYTLPNLMNRIYSENSKQDFSAALKKRGLYLDEFQAEKNRVAGYPAVASLADIVSENELVRARQLIDPNYLINSNFELVTNEEIASLGLVGDLTIEILPSDLSNFEGLTVELKDGATIIASQPVQQKMTFKNIPNGVYHLEFSGEQMKYYLPSENYVYVKETQNHASLSFIKAEISKLADEDLIFYGFSDQWSGSLRTNLNSREATLTLNMPKPHYLFKDELYVKVTIKSQDGKIRYEKSINGDIPERFTDDHLLLEVGDSIEIYHAEARNRLKGPENLIDRGQNTNHWLVTEHGLKHLGLNNNPEKDLMKKIEKLGNSLVKAEGIKPMAWERSMAKKQLWTAIQSLSPKDTEHYMSQYYVLFK